LAADRDPPKPRWPLWVGIFVAVGMAATIAVTVIESWWG
jgi:hypothetical protein